MSEENKTDYEKRCKELEATLDKMVDDSKVSLKENEKLTKQNADLDRKLGEAIADREDWKLKYQNESDGLEKLKAALVESTQENEHLKNNNDNLDLPFFIIKVLMIHQYNELQ